MSDIQRMLDAATKLARESRKPYHLSLGQLRAELDALPHGMTVMADTGAFIGQEHSYRGYYDDLAFEPASEIMASDVGQLRVMVSRAYNDEYIGYKGGEFHYADDTPLWFAPYGCTGLAIVGTRIDDTNPARLILLTKNID
jgi:hypothetical protein